MAETGTSCEASPREHKCTNLESRAGSVAAEGFKLSLLLNAVSSDVANAGLEVQRISKGVTLFSMMLKHTSQVLQAAEPIHSQEAIETAQSIADEGTRAFEEINDMLERVRSAQRHDDAVSPTVQQRVQRSFRQHRVTYLLAQLENLQLSLSVMLQTLQLGRVMASTSRRFEPTPILRRQALTDGAVTHPRKSP